MQKHTIIILLLLFCFPGIECRAQSSIYFMGNPGDSETILDFIVENDSSAVALMNQELPQFDQRVALVKLDTLLNITSCKRIYQPGYVFFGNALSNISNGHSAAEFFVFDQTSNLPAFSINLFDESLDTISSFRITHSLNNFFGFRSLLLKNDTLCGLIDTRDSMNNYNYELIKIDLIAKSIIEAIKITPPTGRNLIINETTASLENNEMAFSAAISTDSTNNFFNPLFFKINTELSLIETLWSLDTLHISGGNPFINYISSDELLMGYYRNNPNTSVGSYCLVNTNKNTGIMFQKLITGGSINYIQTARRLTPSLIGLISRRTTIVLDNNGNTNFKNNLLINPIFGLSNLGLKCINKWKNQYILSGSFNFGTTSTDATNIWVDSTLQGCDYTTNVYSSIDTTINFYPLNLQLDSTNCLLTLWKETYIIDSTNFQKNNYCTTTDLATIKQKNIDISIVPNPATNYLKFDFEVDDNQLFNGIECKIFNQNGQLKKVITDVQPEKLISIEELQPGLYSFVLFNEKGYFATHKIVIL